MRIRSTKPEFWRSSTMAQFGMEDRLILKALESYVDDNGVGRDSVVIFCADAFPHDLAKSPEIVAKVSGALQRFSEADIIVRYIVAGEPLVYVRHWKRWQYIDKPKAGRYPRPDGTMNYRQPVDETIGAGQAVTTMPDRETYTEVPENRAKSSRKPAAKRPQIQSGEQGNRGTGEQTTTTRVDEIPLPPEPPTEDDGVVDTEPGNPPNLIETTSRKSKRHASSAAKTVVRQVLGYDYPRTTVERLAIQVDKLRAEDKPDDLIRASITEWDTREGALPEWLPTVYGDLVKARHATPGNNGRPVHKMRATANLAAEIREAEAQAAVLTAGHRKELA